MARARANEFQPPEGATCFMFCVPNRLWPSRDRLAREAIVPVSRLSPGTQRQARERWQPLRSVLGCR
jgi:hypothetical protein